MSQSQSQEIVSQQEAYLPFSNYRPPSDCYDEVLDPTGAIRPHWNWITGALTRLGEAGVTARSRQAAEILRQNGTTYNAYGEISNSERPWAFDMLPLVLPAMEWGFIEQAIQQRLGLHNAILSDLYGPQDLIARGLIPPDFINSNPAYLRPCHGIAPPKTGHIARYSADLVRGPDGGWMVYAERTEVPSGAGYALENRVVMAQIFPGLFAEGRVRRLASFFEQFGQTLDELAPRRTADPVVVLHTPGPANEVYFEHAYLARYLGIPLLEGGDFTVSDNKVYVKTIQGLQLVDVILRRVDDAFSDPLELRKESALGVAGLIEAVRGGHVTICNTIGSAISEAPALSACLPGLCRDLRGEDLFMPSVPALWGGRPEDHAQMVQNFEGLTFAPAYESTRQRPLSPGTLMGSARDALWSSLHSRPSQHVALNFPKPSTAPVLGREGISCSHLVFRVYAIAGSVPGEVHVMPGGLARFSTLDSPYEISMQQGSGSKDVWILTEGEPPITKGPLAQQAQDIVLRRSPDNISSRLAENLLWLGRYCERAETTVRFLRHVLTRVADESGHRRVPELRRLLAAAPEQLFEDVGGLPAFGVEEMESGGEEAPPDWGVTLEMAQQQLLQAVFDSAQPGSVAQSIGALRRTAWVVRDRFSEDDWRILSGFTDTFLSQSQRGRWPDLGMAFESLNQLVSGFAALSGLIHENMTREPGQLFIDIGRRLERGAQTARLLVKTLHQPTPESETDLLQSILAICDSPMTYRARYGGSIQVSAVVDLLVCDDTNPRSVMYQLDTLARRLSALPKAGKPGLLNEEERIVERLNTLARCTDGRELAKIRSGGKRSKLATLLGKITQDLPTLAARLEQRYFIHTAPAQSLEGTTRRPPAP